MNRTQPCSWTTCIARVRRGWRQLVVKLRSPSGPLTVEDAAAADFQGPRVIDALGMGLLAFQIPVEQCVPMER
jgi:hypothetical protein